MPDPFILSPEKCRNLLWQPPGDLTFAANQPLIPLHAGELSRAAASMPLALVKRDNRWQLVGVCGLAPDRNLFVNQGRWMGSYRPLWLHTWPFEMIQVGDKAMVTFDKESGLLTQTGGEPFFDDAGQPGPALKRVLEHLKETHARYQATDRALRALAAAGVITPWPANVCQSLGLRIPGLHMIDETALAALDGDGFLKLRKALPVAYAVNLSIWQTHLLTRLAKINPSGAPVDEALRNLLNDEDDPLRFS